MLTTRRKIRLAALISRLTLLTRGIFGRTAEAVVTRGHLRWHLDLGEGIDLAIYLGVYERRTLRAWRRLVKPGSVVLDIGANIGAHTLPLARLVGPEGKVIAIEPAASAFQKLCKNLELNPSQARRVDAYQAMLLDTPTAEVPAAVYASWPLAKREERHPRHLGALRETIGAYATTLDDFLACRRITNVDLIKLDVDGYEDRVLKGATNTLNRVGPVIVMEIAPYVFDEVPGAFAELLAILDGSGYGLQDLGSGEPLPLDESGLRARIPNGAGVNAIARPKDGPSSSPLTSCS